MRWTKEQYIAYEARRLSSHPKPEQVVRDEPLAEEERETKNPARVAVLITSYRKRLLDPDNLCPKHFIDGLRYAGIIPNDRPQDITLQVRQEKSKDERTEIEIIPG